MDELVMAQHPADADLDAEALKRLAMRITGVTLALVVALVAVGTLVLLRSVGRTWAEDDVMACRASAFVEGASAGGHPAADRAMHECLTHRRHQRWGPWRAFGDANDASKYNAPDD